MNWLRHSTAQKGNWHPLLNNYVSSRIIADCIYDVLCFVFFFPMSMNMIVHIHVNTVKPLILRSAIWIPRIESKLHHGRTWCNFDSIWGIQPADCNMTGFTSFTCICKIQFIEKNKKKHNVRHHSYSQQWSLMKFNSCI